MRGKWQGGIKGLLDKCVRESNGEIWLNEEMIRRIKGRSMVEKKMAKLIKKLRNGSGLRNESKNIKHEVFDYG